ncbi:hypothetical protein QLG07_06500 [Erwinia sp. V90_4]|uniref:hypothetical protein n=1 Tax=Erwinia TaxID=551 RepID=UPI001AAA518C|nr:hypothetical protein [Erwinia sp. V90_4]MBN1084168.1 hypothetical protein [Erwinia aphidicola]MDI3439097.1 hypothetical protein [Erwinia sp. V90_4]
MINAEFSLRRESTQFIYPESDKKIDIAKGVDYILSGITAQTSLTAWHLEMMIYRTEEIIEADATIRPIHGEIVCREPLLKSVCASYLDGASIATPEHIEAAFNKLADDISYHPLSLSDEALPVLAWFVFIREITHHLGITAVRAA